MFTPPTLAKESAASVVSDPEAAIADKLARRAAAALDAAETDYLLARSAHAREVEAGGFMFAPHRDTAISRDDVGDAAFAAILMAGYLTKSHIDAGAYEAARRSGDATPAKPAPDPETSRYEALKRENDRLREDLAAAHREIALLTGIRTGGQGPVSDRKDDGSPAV